MKKLYRNIQGVKDFREKRKSKCTKIAFPQKTHHIIQQKHPIDGGKRFFLKPEPFYNKIGYTFKKKFISFG